MKSKRAIIVWTLCICAVFGVYCVKIIQNRFCTDVADQGNCINDGQNAAIDDINDTLLELDMVPQCIWGTWVMTEELHGQYGWGECRNVPQGMTVKFSPTGFSFQNDDQEVSGYACSLIAIADINEYYRETGQFRELGMEGNYYLKFYPEWDDWGDEIGWGWEYILISATELVIPEARNGMYRMEKVEEYVETDEDDGPDYVRINPYRSMCYGTWEITEQIGRPCQSVNVGDGLDIRGNKGYVVSCRILDRTDEQTEKVAEWIGLGYGNRYLVCCYFSQDCFWDYMLIRDGMTAVLAKGDCIYQVRRISDPEKDSIYYELG